MSKYGAAVISFFSTDLILTTLYRHVLQRLLHFPTLFSYYLHYSNMGCSDKTIFQHLHYAYMCWSIYFIFQDLSVITYNISTCAAAVISLYSSLLLLPTLCQHVLQRLPHFTALVSNNLHYINMSSSGYLIFQHCSIITYTMSTWAAAVNSFFSTGLE
jgi:hypothetical protein